MKNPKILILTVSHGAAHRQVGNVLRQVLLEAHPGVTVEVIDALQHCAAWFRAYYNSYQIPLRYWPSLWGWIENIQHKSSATGPGWLYRRGGEPLFRFIRSHAPDVVIATEVGMCELAALLKRETDARFFLVGVTAGVEIDRAWVQPEVDLYPVAPGDGAGQLAAAGAPAAKILPCGTPVDPAFGACADRGALRQRLSLEDGVPVLLVLFGGTGFGKPRRIKNELMKLIRPLHVVFIAGKNQELENELRQEFGDAPRYQVLGWVDNMADWMAAADLLLSKPGGATVAEAINSRLPLLAFDPLPGAEWRTCDMIEKWGTGHWIRRVDELAPTLQRLLDTPEELQRLGNNARSLARPRAAHDAAEAILKLCMFCG